LTEQINIRIFSAINKYAGDSPLLDNVVMVITEYLPFAFIGVLIYLWFSSKVDGKHSALCACYAAFVAILINRFITLFYIHPRPFMKNIGTTLINHAPDSSFPSDHTTFMLSIAAMLLFIRSTRIIGCILFFLGLLGGASRVFCGVHFPQDIFGSLVVSMVTTTILWTLREKLTTITEYIVNVYLKTFSIKKT